MTFGDLNFRCQLAAPRRAARLHAVTAVSLATSAAGPLGRAMFQMLGVFAEFERRKLPPVPDVFPEPCPSSAIPAPSEGWS